jgi:hypothetical protein
MTSKDLKAIAYDLISNIEFFKNKLAEVNQQIADALEKEKQSEDDRAADTTNNS